MASSGSVSSGIMVLADKGFCLSGSCGGVFCGMKAPADMDSVLYDILRISLFWSKGSYWLGSSVIWYPFDIIKAS